VCENRHPAFSGKAKRFSRVGIVADEAVDKGMQVGLAPLPANLVASGDLLEFLSAFYDVAGSAKLTQNLD
jgi:hypothetical protein